MRSPDAPNRSAWPLTLLSALALAACSGTTKRYASDDEPTIKTLAGRDFVVAPDPGIPASEDQAIAAYNRFLAATPNAPQRPQALRRLGDLAMDSADTRLASSAGGNRATRRLMTSCTAAGTHPVDPRPSRGSRSRPSLSSSWTSSPR